MATRYVFDGFGGFFSFMCFSLLNKIRRHEKEREIRGKFIKRKLFCVTDGGGAHPKLSPCALPFPTRLKKKSLAGSSPRREEPVQAESGFLKRLSGLKRFDGSMLLHAFIKNKKMKSNTFLGGGGEKINTFIKWCRRRSNTPTCAHTRRLQRRDGLRCLYTHTVQVSRIVASDLPIDGNLPSFWTTAAKKSENFY